MEKPAKNNNCQEGNKQEIYPGGVSKVNSVLMLGFRATWIGSTLACKVLICLPIKLKLQLGADIHITLSIGFMTVDFKLAELLN